VSPAVLRTVAGLTALDVQGVVAIGKSRGPENRRTGLRPNDAVKVEIREQQVVVDIDLVVEGSANVVETGRAVQSRIAEALESLVGFPVESVNVRIQDVV